MNEQLRRLFPVTDEYAYLNHAAVSAPPIPVTDAVLSQISDVQKHGVINYKKWIATKDRARRGVAALLKAEPEQVAFMRNTSDGISTIANGLKWREGDNIVTFRCEFPSNIYPWLRIRDNFGVEVRMCDEHGGRIDLDELIELIDGRTRVVALSSVQYGSGFNADLERIGRACRKHDAQFDVDSIQSLGVVPMDVNAQFVDAAAGACHKWLLSPEGIGYLYLSDRARERIEPTLVGWISVADPEDYNNFDQEWKTGALAWETGTGPTSLFYGLDAGLGILQATGIDSIHQYLGELTDYLCEMLAIKGYEVISSRNPSEKSQIVSLNPKPGWTAMSLYILLKQNKVIAAPRGERLRISPHFYNNTADIDRLMDALP
jgi:cysteine desulfurase/selenocysteine lyase